ncbi:MAG: RNHCP domain-containing protein [Clostridia bacterium]|nr:RNHCP domain-containing protein [Clostridia bacterium]
MEKGLFTEIDEEFICHNCGKEVTKLGYSCRNHCPYCLHSKHVDKNPGDRLEECHGDLEPVGLEIDGKKGYVIIFRCKKCGAIRKNKAAKDDNMDLIIDLSAKGCQRFRVKMTTLSF